MLPIFFFSLKSVLYLLYIVLATGMHCASFKISLKALSVWLMEHLNQSINWGRTAQENSEYIVENTWDLRDRETWIKILVLASIKTSTGCIYKMEIINLTSKWSYENERGSGQKNTKDIPDICPGRKLFWKAPHFCSFIWWEFHFSFSWSSFLREM